MERGGNPQRQAFVQHYGSDPELHEWTPRVSLCTLSYVDALARAGQLEQARLIFEKMLTYANQLGPYSEEIGRTGEQLGNFPQAFSPTLALIDAAITLDAALARAGRS